MLLQDKVVVKFGESGSAIDQENLQGSEVSEPAAMLCFSTWVVFTQV